METKVGISGTGRIGRLLIRKILSDTNKSLKLVAINSIYPAETVAQFVEPKLRPTVCFGPKATDDPGL